MSLQVWMPLRGDLRNQGLSDQTSAITTTPTWATVGKLGDKSLYTKTRQTTMHFPGLVGVSTYSVAYWLYIPTAIAPTAWTDMFGIAFNCAGTTVWERDERRAATTTGRHNYHLAKSASEGSNTNAYYGTREDDSANDNWVHYVLTKDNSSAKLYADGTLVVTVPAANFESTKRTMTGDIYFGDNGCEAYLNDFRIYDHCLSENEIKRLAQGLIVHYPLNRQGWGQENLYHYSKDFSNWTFYSGVTTTTDNGETVITYPDTADVWPGAIAKKTILYSKVRNKTITVSADLKADNGVSCGFDPCLILTSSESSVTRLKYKDNTINFTGTGKWIHWSATYNITDALFSSGTGSPDYTNCYFSITFYRRITPTGSFKLKNPKVELGSIATPWCPNVSDELATSMGLNDNTEYDISGFCNNGTRMGTFEWTSDTPKYSVSTQFNSTSTKIAITGLTTTGFANSYSFAWWGKASTFSGKMQWGFSDGVRLNGIYNGNLWNTGDSSDNPLYQPGTTTQVTAPTTNTWHHFVMVGDGSTCKVYKDGELWGQAKTYKTISGTTIYLNGWNSATNYTYDSLQLSDFRIYATALSADDVKSLYQNCATIDSNGVIHGQIRS